MNEIFKKLTCDCDGDCLIEQGYTMSTMAYYPPVYNKDGVNINPDRNSHATNYSCRTCNRRWNCVIQGEDLEITEDAT